MLNVVKRIDFISIKMIKESSFQYLALQILSHRYVYEMIKE